MPYRFLAALALCVAAFADSPLTSTDIAAAYKDQPVVAKALAMKASDDEILRFLADSKVALEFKIAAINANGWRLPSERESNSMRLFNQINADNRYKNFDEFLNGASGEELICVAYLRAIEMYDYHHKIGDKTVAIARLAKRKSPQSYAVNIVAALIEAQQAFDSDWCEVYAIADRLRRDSSLIKDMRDEAIANIFEYMDLYGEECDGG
ncbi:MAG: hypothetical protein LBC09_01305 [Helicobacteraceae bacterium]|jgi:hypothetical protein|nr:hypothetical protein [Helicobacteraceae bacterium]